MKAKLIMMCVGVVLFLVFVLPGLMNIGQGYNKDLNDLTNIDKMQSRTIDPEHPFIGMTPNGSKAVVKEIDGVNAFFDGVAQFFLMLMLIGAAIFVYYIIQKSKDEEKKRQEWDRRYGKGSYDRIRYPRY